MPAAYLVNVNLRLPDDNFKNVVPKVLNDRKYDAVVLQTGSIEICNIKVNDAVMDTSHDIKYLEKKWFSAVEDDSKKLFEIAEKEVEKNPDLKVIIIKRLPRYDKGSKDILKIKSKLSTYANNVYDQLLLKSNHASNIHVVELNLQLEKSSSIRDLVFGHQSSDNFDGIHLRGKGASRHFTYRAVQAMSPFFRHKSPERVPRSSIHKSDHNWFLPVYGG